MIYMYLLKARTFIALLLVIAFFSVMVPNFLTASNLLIMTQHVAITGLLAIGMTLVILTGGIDLSVGAVAGICGMVAGAIVERRYYFLQRAGSDPLRGGIWHFSGTGEWCGNHPLWCRALYLHPRYDVRRPWLCPAV